MKELAQGFAPLVATGARVLILGSMPGAASLRQGQYYAHPRNQFWLIMDALFQVGLDQPYARRCQTLLNQGIAVWDVIGRCQRPGSLDAAIVEDTIILNDLPAFFARHQTIGQVFFNGAKAKKIYDQYLLDTLPDTLQIDYRRLPSTSPAHAALSLQEKIEAWRQVENCLTG